MDIFYVIDLGTGASYLWWEDSALFYVQKLIIKGSAQNEGRPIAIFMVDFFRQG